MKRLLSIIFVGFTLLFLPHAVYAMHITEGILPPKWAILWFLVAAPFVAIGTYKIKKRRKAIPGYMPLIGMIGAAVFVFSCFPVPVIALNGMATAHPAGTGMSAIFLGPFVSVPVAGIALLIQALFLAHGGLTTLGGNIFSMGILGSFSGYFAFWTAKKLRLSPFWWGFFAGIVADIFTYLGTSIELGLLVVGKGDSFFKAAGEIFAAFMMTTQGPLCILEGVVTGFIVSYVYNHRPSILVELGITEGRTIAQI
ncbi:MAG TPA: energy-coupling factor ABC transporter permease [Candidatus Brocadiia bacterium]|nr:energy-coupling factor ABC transporter permease [Planctomycetota bacterium]MDO8093402.1 energy-coupling factor ABC transporter permease [Candidatus Brocadiales bacterium]